MGIIRIVAMGLLVAGCAPSQVMLTVRSQPEGAYIVPLSTGPYNDPGLAPRSYYWNKKVVWAKGRVDANGCTLVSGYVARWISGVETRIDSLTICKKIGYSQEITLRRDPSVPGFDRDLQFAVQIQTLWAQQQAAIAAGQAADAASAAAGAAMINAINSAQPVRCRTIQVGNSLQTTCN